MHISAMSIRLRLPTSCRSENTQVSPRWYTMVSWKLMSRPAGTLAAQLAGQLEADRDPDQHAQAGLLGQHRAHGAHSFAEVVVPGRLADGLALCRLEPSALVESGGEHAAQRGRAARDHILCLAQ